MGGIDGRVEPVGLEHIPLHVRTQAVNAVNGQGLKAWCLYLAEAQ
jgi:hypothetical protein